MWLKHENIEENCMKKTKKRQIALILGIIAIVAIIGLGFTACDDGSGSTTVAVTGVTVAPATLALTVGGSTGTLTATIAPSNATNQAVTWSTSNAAVATVSNGIVTAVSAGTAAITVTTIDGSLTATCAVTVTAGGSTTVAVTGVTVAPATLALTVGGSTGTLTATITPSNATNQAVTWSTSNAAVATVSNGIVTAVSAGTATITVTTTDGSKTATCTVTVTAGGGFVPEYAIYDTGPGGGIIIYVSASGFNVAGLGTRHYLEAAHVNQGTSLAWASSGYTSTYIAGTGTAIGTGKANTAAILAVDANAPAAKACADYRGGGKDDWFLPSKDELNVIYNVKSYLDNSPVERFWSSSQYDSSASAAWHQFFYYGTKDYISKYNEFYVRAIRAF
jgi:hypothetical protein